MFFVAVDQISGIKATKHWYHPRLECICNRHWSLFMLLHCLCFNWLAVNECCFFTKKCLALT